MTEPTDSSDRARAVWAAGDFDAVASRTWAVGGRIVDRLGLQPGEAVLDVACGSGNAALPAAEAGARVVGADITPELFEAGRRRAAAAGVEIEWVVGDAEALPFADAGFDAVVSTFGVMFAPRHEVAAAELCRVLRPGGRLGLCSWTPEGGIGDFFRTVAQHVPPAADGPPPVLWGTEEHVRDLLAPAGLDLAFARETVTLDFASADEGVAFYADNFGPVVRAREALEPQGRWPALRDDLAATFARHNVADDGGLAFPAEYLAVIGRR
jgi:SAM-dependent methyltransferase